VNKSPTVCTGCSNGCNVYAESRGNVIYRLLPRRNEEVNQVWMCDEGRLTYHATNEKRVEWAHTGRGDTSASVGRASPSIAQSSAEAAARAGRHRRRRLRAVPNEESRGRLSSSERRLGASRYFLAGSCRAIPTIFLIRADKNPNKSGVLLAADAFRREARGRARNRSGEGAGRHAHRRASGRQAGPARSLRRHRPERGRGYRGSGRHAACKSVYEQDGSLINWYGRLQRTWNPSRRSARHRRGMCRGPSAS